jgi:uncharacterized membrane protein
VGGASRSGEVALGSALPPTRRASPRRIAAASAEIPVIAYALWNLFLACLPIPFGRALARRLDPATGPAPWRRPSTIAIGLAWLLLLPNAPYLLTEIRHFVLDPRWRAISDGAAHHASAFRRTAAWGLAFALTGAVGVVAFTMALRPVEQAMKARGASLFAMRAVLFPLTALGVWLGLIPRFNSWDMLTRPLDVIGTAAWAIVHPPTAACVAVYALVLAALYVVASAAYDGWRLRRASP